MKKPVLLVSALILALAAVLVLWRALEAPGRGSPRGATPAAAPAAEVAAPAAIAAPAAPLAEAAPAATGEGASAAPDTQAERTAATAGGRTLRGSVLLPAGAPQDETLRVLALSEALTPRQVYGVGGLLDDVAAGKQAEKLLASVTVDATGRFTLPLAAESKVWLALDGRFLYSTRAVPVAPGEGAVELEGKLGARVLGRVQLPAGVADPAAALRALELALQPDGENFSLGASDLPLRRRARADAEGRFELRAVQAGYAQELEVDSEHCADTRVKVAELAPGRTEELTVVLSLGASLRGVVRTAGGQPLAGAEVRAAETGFWGFPGEELAKATCDAEGAFDLRHVRPGKILLLAEGAGYLEIKPMELELREGEERGGLVLTLEEGAAIAGHARFPDGAPAAGAAIDVGFDPAAMVGMGAMNAARGADGKATAAADGSFRVSGLGKGPFRVTARLDRDAGPGSDEWRGRTAGVAPGTSDVLVELRAPVALVGRVLERSGAPVRTFRVRAQLPSAVFFEQAEKRDQSFEDETGAFRLADLDPGTWEVTASAEGFGPSTTLLVSVPQEGEPLVITLAPAASVTGTVLDPQGAPVAGAKVAPHVDTAQRLQRLRGDADRPEAVSKEDGTFLLTGLAEGRSAIEAQAQGFAGSDPLEVDLRAGETSTGLVLRLRRGATVTGEVYGPDGKPVSVRVMAQAPGGLEMSMAQSDGEGRFRIAGLDPGAWTITAMLQGGSIDPEGEADDMTAGFLENLRFTMVQLEEGEEEHVVLGAPPKDPVVVRGRVRHGDEPVTNGIVSFFAQGSKGMEAMKVANLDSAGRYEARLDEPGKYFVSVQVTGGTSAFQQHTIEFRATVPEVEEHTLDLALPLGGVRGTVRDAQRQPLGNARVSLVTEGGVELGSMLGGQYSETVTDASGAYEFLYLRPGEYAVAAGGALFGGAFGNESASGRTLRAGLRVAEGRTLEGVDFQLETPGSIAGKVLDTAGQPVKDASLFVRDASGRLLDRFSMTTSSADGTFEYKGLAPGEYVVSARGKSLASLESAPVRVEAGEKASVELTLLAGTKLLVEVVDAEGTPAAVRVSVTDPNGRTVTGMLGWAEMSALFADGLDGERTVVGPLPPGTYTVTAIAADGKKTTKPVELDGQPERRLKLRLR
ncbi:MAG TPA: carboxypeptidase-like regulatory domain-containing protein [Planctomycetota bacterium]